MYADASADVFMLGKVKIEQLAMYNFSHCHRGKIRCIHTFVIIYSKMGIIGTIDNRHFMIIGIHIICVVMLPA